MGKWFKRFFENLGHAVIVSGRKTPVSSIDCAKKSDIVIVTVPINATVEVIKQIGKFVREDALLMDFTSVKEEPVKTIRKVWA